MHVCYGKGILAGSKQPSLAENILVLSGEGPVAPFKIPLNTPSPQIDHLKARASASPRARHIAGF